MSGEFNIIIIRTPWDELKERKEIEDVEKNGK